MPRTSVLSIRNAARADLTVLQAIIDAQPDHRPLLGGPDVFRRDPHGFTLVAESGHGVVGVCLGTVMKPGPVAQVLRSGLPDVLHARRIGLLDTVAIHPEHTGHGLGTRLTQAARTHLRRHKTGVWAAAALKTPRGVGMGVILERAGLEPFAEVPDFWRQHRGGDRDTCPACGELLCRCPAVMYAGAI